MQSTIERLKWSLQALAQPSEVQISLYPDFVVVADELALDFAHWFELTMSYSASQFAGPQVNALQAINEKLDSMSGQENEHHWTLEALHTDPLWYEVRLLAKQALAVLAWPTSAPPSDPAQRGSIYMPGK